jgi:plasmid replication initiation protein
LGSSLKVQGLCPASPQGADCRESEIDQLAHFTVEWDEIRQGRAVVEIVFRFAPKDAPAQLQTVDELAKHSAGRRARRDDSVEAIVEDENAVPHEKVERCSRKRLPA